MKKLACLAALLLALALVLTACGNKIEGTWTLTNAGYNDEDGKFVSQMTDAEGYSMEMTFKDGKATVSETIDSVTETHEGTYEVKDNQVTVTIDGDDGIFTLDGKTLTYSSDSTVMIFTKK